MRYRLQRHDGTDCSATMVPFTVLRMVPIQRYRHMVIRYDPLHLVSAYHVLEVPPETLQVHGMQLRSPYARV